MDVYIQSEAGTCNEFTRRKGGEKEVVSVVISPLKIQTENEGMNLRVISGCNMWQGCFNASCHFSRAGRQLPRVESRK